MSISLYLLTVAFALLRVFSWGNICCGEAWCLWCWSMAVSGWPT